VGAAGIVQPRGRGAPGRYPAEGLLGVIGLPSGKKDFNLITMFRNLLAQQFRRPSGILGYYAANFMRKNNQEYYQKAIDLLDIHDNETILEIGCGAGYAIQQIHERFPGCMIQGIDFSPQMLSRAKRNNKQALSHEKLTLISGDFISHDFTDSTYSKIFAINVIYFWNELAPVFAKLNTLLRPDGKLLLFMSSPERLKTLPMTSNDTVFNKYSLDFVEKELGNAGFSAITVETVVKAGFETFYICAGK
jgi:cyclopropane fatty-acyl-phospholipid synthase-like methyltransferase